MPRRQDLWEFTPIDLSIEMAVAMAVEGASHVPLSTSPLRIVLGLELHVHEERDMQNTNSIVKLIRLADVQKLTGMARSTIYERMAQGAFPRPLRLSVRHVAWKEQDILHWIESLPVSNGAVWIDNRAADLSGANLNNHK